ncbi:MAG: hypothetical protein HQM09_24695 [Candidatus Riflebacteria bacterium]|nr:hypothetical protein [Candidatus Riflebacteria bacterium]
MTELFKLFLVCLPVPVAVIWSLVLMPFEFGANAFSMPAAIGSAMCLSLCLWMSRGTQDRKWLILPTICFLYEMLPVNIPGPFDDYFAFGGTFVTTVMMKFMARARETEKMTDVIAEDT